MLKSIRRIKKAVKELTVTVRISWYSNSAAHHSENGDTEWREQKLQQHWWQCLHWQVLWKLSIWVGRYVRVSESSSLEWGKKLFVFIATLIHQSKDHVPDTIIHTLLKEATVGFHWHKLVKKPFMPSWFNSSSCLGIQWAASAKKCTWLVVLSS